MALLEDVHLRYPGSSTEALAGVTLTIEPGEHVCILGGNGSGKSTLLQLLNVLALPSAGRVRMFGIDTADPSRTIDIRSRTATVFQHPEDQMVTSIVADDVAFGPENLCVAQPHIAQRVDEALLAVDMLERAQSDPSDLSGGQMQRVAIAGALAMKPEVLLLDEPCAMLDAEGRAGVRGIIARASAAGITVVHVTHFAEDALAAERAIVLDHGRVAFDGDPRRAVQLLGLDRDAEPDEGAMPGAAATHGASAGSGVASRPGAPSDPDGAALLQSGLFCCSPAHQHKVATSDPNSAQKVAVCAGESQGSTMRPSNGATVVFKNVSFSYVVAKNPRRAEKKGLLSGLFGKGRLAKSAGSASNVASIASNNNAAGTNTSLEARAATSTTARLEVRGVASTNAPLALSSLSFTARPGTLTALIGRTGSGKSTTAELACALKLPLEGTVHVGGVDTADLSRRRELRRLVGYVSQLPERQLFAETVFDDVAFGPRNLGLPDPEISLRVREALSSVNLDPTDDLLKRSPFTLSGGQQRSVALAGVLAMKQPVLVLDEPMAGLDPAGRAQVRALIRSLKQAGTTLIMVTHSMADVAALADQAIALEHGRVIASGSPDEVLAVMRPRPASPHATEAPAAPAPIPHEHQEAHHGVAL
ncbi:MAG: energy-coupling factor transporter ATPase [Coriobacteriaceae bacterium]|nr:energy-coupling factor transporter ATPase [Coriobacteriaceae bacterium]